MSFKSNDFKGLKIEFAEILASQYTSSEIKLIWRESMCHYFAISSTELLLSEHRVFTSEEIEKIKGKQSKEIEKILGYLSKTEIIHKDDMVLL